jgi:hypothetical protein
MEIRKIIDTYYELANKGKWNEWCDLFSSDVIINEQLAGAIEGLSTLKSMMQGMDKGYSHFANIPKHIIIQENEAAVVSHISARASKSPDIPIEADVMNYFRIKDSKIYYMANFHDSKPFKPFLDQLF